MKSLTLQQQAKAQEDAARHCRSIGMGYLASRHETLARKLRADAAKQDVKATERAEAS